jgi:hypothetical protein
VIYPAYETIALPRAIYRLRKVSVSTDSLSVFLDLLSALGWREVARLDGRGTVVFTARATDFMYRLHIKGDGITDASVSVAVN